MADYRLAALVRQGSARPKPVSMSQSHTVRPAVPKTLASMMPTRNVAAAVAAFRAASAAVSEMFSGLMAFLHLRRAG